MDSMRKVLRLPPFQFRNEYFLFLLPLFFVFHGFGEYYGMITLRDGLLLVGKYMLLILAVTFLLSLLFRAFLKGALFSFVFFCFFFFFGAAHDWLRDHAPVDLFIRYTFIIPFSLLAFVGLGLYLERTGRTFHRVTIYLNTLLGVLLLVEAGGLLLKKPAGEDIIYEATVANPVVTELIRCDTCPSNDIHLIIVDEYAGEKELEEVLHFDNKPFFDTLEAKGFRVLKKTQSNYNYTEISTASLLSLNYIKGLDHRSDNELYHIGSSIIRQNVFTRFLRGQGYAIHNFSIFDVDSLPAYNPHFHPRISLVTGNTFGARVSKDIGFHLAYTLKLHFILNRMTRTLEKEAAMNSRIMESVIRRVAASDTTRPHFYYTHLLLPHEPFFFTSDGIFTGLKEHMYPGSPEEKKKTYIEYLQYANKKLLSFIDALLKTAKRPPIIILMSDHGYRGLTIKPVYHFSSLNAIYFPDQQYDGFYDCQTSVNQLRVLLNQRFHQKLPLLKDSIIFLGNLGH